MVRKLTNEEKYQRQRERDEQKNQRKSNLAELNNERQRAREDKRQAEITRAYARAAAFEAARQVNNGVSKGY